MCWDNHKKLELRTSSPAASEAAGRRQQLAHMHGRTPPCLFPTPACIFPPAAALHAATEGAQCCHRTAHIEGTVHRVAAAVAPLGVAAAPARRQQQAGLRVAAVSASQRTIRASRVVGIRRSAAQSPHPAACCPCKQQPTPCWYAAGHPACKVWEWRGHLMRLHKAGLLADLMQVSQPAACCMPVLSLRGHSCGSVPRSEPSVEQTMATTTTHVSRSCVSRKMCSRSSGCSMRTSRPSHSACMSGG